MPLHPAELDWLEQRYPGDQPFEQRIRLGRRRIQRRRATTGFVIAFLVVVVFGAQIESPRIQSYVDNRPGWLWGAGLVLLLIGLGLMGFGLARGARGGALEARRDSPLWGLTWQQRHSVYARLRGRARVDPDDILFLRAIGLSLAAQTYVPLVCGGLAIATLGPLIAEQTTVARMILGAAAVLGLGGYALVAWRDARTGARYAAAHPVVGDVGETPETTVVPSHPG